MKKVSVVIALALLIMALGYPSNSVSAYGKFTSYASGVQLQNLSATPATVQLQYYNADGTIDTTFADPTEIPAYGSRTYFPVHASTGFGGSVVVSSSQPLAAISNLLGSGTYSGAAAYVGFSSGSNTVAIPLLMKGNSSFDTWFSVQNTGSADATVNISYSDGTTAGPLTIKVGSSVVVDQAAETHSAKVFSAVVTSDQPLAIVVIEESTKLLFAYTTSAGAINPVLPLINTNNNGIITGVQIQNTGTSNTDVTVTYTPAGAGTSCTETQTIPAQSSSTFALSSFAGTTQTGMTTTCVKERFIGSAKVTANSANVPLIAITNQLTPTSGEAYGNFDPAAATSTVVFPLVMDRNSGWFTGFSVMNVGDTATTISCVFTNTTYTLTADLTPGQAVTDIQNGKIADKYVGSATCTANNSGKIVGVLNEARTIVSGDTLLVYEGINAQ